MKKWKKITLAIVGIASVCAIVPACVISCSSVYDGLGSDGAVSNKTLDYDAAMEIYQNVVQTPIVSSSNGWTTDSALSYFKNNVQTIINKSGMAEVLINVLPVNMIVQGLDSAYLGFSNQNFTNPYFDVTTNFNIKDFTANINSDNTATIKANVTYSITDKNDKGILTFTNTYEWDNVSISKTLSKIGNCYYGALQLTNSKNGLELSPNSSFLNNVNVTAAFSTADFGMLCNVCQWLPRPANIDPSASISNQLSQIKNAYQKALSLGTNKISFSSNNLLLSNWFLSQDQVFCYQNIYNFGYINTNYISNPIYDDANDSYNWTYNNALTNYTKSTQNINDYASLINTALQQQFFEYDNNQLIKGDASTINSWHLLTSSYKDNTLSYDLQVKITSYPKGVTKPLTASFDVDIKETNVNITSTLIPISNSLSSNPAGYGGYSWINSNNGKLSITYNDFVRSANWTNYLAVISFNNVLSPLQSLWNNNWTNSSSITNTYSFSELKQNKTNDPANSLYLLSMVNTNSNNLYYYHSISNWFSDAGNWYYLNVINYV